MTRDSERLREDIVRLLPTRGLVTLHNRRGRMFDAGDVQRWIHVNRLRNHTAKIDLLDYYVDIDRLGGAMRYARSLGVHCSLRTLATALPPRELTTLCGQDMLDVFLVVHEAGANHLKRWLDVCASHQCPVRVQFPLVLVETHVALLETCATHSAVRVIQLAMDDPFSPTAPRTADWSRHHDIVRRLADLARDQGIEYNLLDLPFCQAEELSVHILNRRQCAAHHQQYHTGSYAWAEKFYRRSPAVLHAGLRIVQKQGTMMAVPFEDRLLRWILERPWRSWTLQLVRRFLRMLVPSRWRTRGAQPSPDQYMVLAEAHQRQALSRIAAPCTRCRLRWICDRPIVAFRVRYPSARIQPIDGDTLVDPLVFTRNQPVYFDPVDMARLPDAAKSVILAQHALQRLASGEPSRVVSYHDYRLVRGYFDRTGAGLRWFSLSDAEYATEPVAPVRLPVTIATEFSGGLADYVGFKIGRWGRVVCHADGFKHELVLHAEHDGSFVLIDNGRQVHPLNFEYGMYLPERLPDAFEPVLVASGIDLSLTTRDVRIWEGALGDSECRADTRFSVLIVCNRYARRLQAALAAIAHQKGVPLQSIEAVVDYTPNVDATEDVLDSIRGAHPDLRIVRVPFDESRQSIKGFQINEAARLASGEWIVLLDADIILPPDFFARLGAVDVDACFVAPDGRKMLVPETTGKILLGEVQPWEQWDDLVAGPGEWRRRESEGLPVGFCQCVRAHCLREVPYAEIHGYEYADMKFAKDVVTRYGPVTWLEGVPVLHLDHGGSQWYGTHKHR